MDNLVLVRVSVALDRSFTSGVLRAVRQDDAHRFRFLFDLPSGRGSLLVSLRPELPWIGRPRGEWPGPGRQTHPFAGACSRLLGGSVLRGVKKDPVDRVVRLSFADGRSLVAELATHGANLVQLDPDGCVEHTARSPRRSRERLERGARYAPPPLPGSLLDPFTAEEADLNARFAARLAEGETPAEALRRCVFGIGGETVELLLRESGPAGSVGATLVRRIGDLTAGRASPVVEAPCEPLEAAEAGKLERGSCRLLPWTPDEPPPHGVGRFVLRDAAATAGLYYEALERQALVEQRWTGLRTLVDRELVRLASAAAAANRDLESFSDPERHRLFGEALLAGLRTARVQGDRAVVSDPYSPDGAEMAVPIRPGTTLTDAAQSHFERHRRGLRGIQRARERVGFLEEQRRSLAAILDRYDGSTGFETLLAMEQALRQHGLPVALEPRTRSGRALHRVSRPRLEGVRVLSGRTGATILVGKGGRENDRLTFRLAGPEDLWFHALGRPGAHVVVRLPSGPSAEGTTGKRPPPDVVAEAAAVAAWFSDGRTEARVDVQWTRRKYVRRRRGAGPGAVIIKKFETVRVRPRLPDSQPGRGRSG